MHAVQPSDGNMGCMVNTSGPTYHYGIGKRLELLSQGQAQPLRQLNARHGKLPAWLPITPAGTGASPLQPLCTSHEQHGFHRSMMTRPGAPKCSWRRSLERFGFRFPEGCVCAPGSHLGWGNWVSQLRRQSPLGETPKNPMQDSPCSGQHNICSAFGFCNSQNLHIQPCAGERLDPSALLL